MSNLAQNAVALQRPQAARYMTATLNFVPTEAMIRAAYEAFEAPIPLLQNVAGLSWVINMEPLPPQLYAHDDLSGNALSLTRKNETLVVSLVSPSWTDLSHDEVVYKAAQSIVTDIDARAKALGAYDP
ncbi:hypothetical protein E8E14_014229 [Neopestalotiopsis sp. 37M]|nr:hypothetical protein E8E14_014229 [Neopestalotiopsis sp. 37M]